LGDASEIIKSFLAAPCRRCQPAGKIAENVSVPAEDFHSRFKGKFSSFGLIVMILKTSNASAYVSHEAGLQTKCPATKRLA
jgi:hypothetical protein